MKQVTFKNSWSTDIKGDILSGITVAFALIPEAIAFSLICGVDPIVGLHASFCIAVIISIFGSRSGMISGATGAMALVMVSLVKGHGIEYMFAATVLTGILLLICSRLKFGELINFVPDSVVHGFVNALAILIFMAQLPHFVGASWVMYAMVAATLGIIYLLPKITKAVPSALVALLAMIIFTQLAGIHVKTVGDMGTITASLPMFHLPQVPFTLDTLKIILPYSITLCMVAIIESLLTATRIDEITDTKSEKNIEINGQGLANLVAGFFGGMAGCALIGQSIINIKSGGRGRLSTLTSGVVLLFLVLCLSNVVRSIPIAALVGVMIMVSIGTFEWKSFKELGRMPKNCALSMIATMCVIVFSHNLALGVFTGIIISSLVFAWKTNNVSAQKCVVEEDGIEHMHYKIQGQLFFASTSKFIELFNYAGNYEHVTIDFEASNVWDYSAVNCILKVKEKYERLDKHLSIIGLNQQSVLVINKVNPSLL